MTSSVEIVLVNNGLDGFFSDVRQLLDYEPYAFIEASYAEVNLGALKSYANIALVFVALDQPRGGFDVIHSIKAYPQLGNIPVILLLRECLSEQETKQYLKMGIVAVLMLPLQPELFSLKITGFIEIYLLKCRLEYQESLRKKLEADNCNLYKMIDVSLAGMVMADANADIQGVNKTFCKTTGYLASEVMGNSLQTLYSDNHTDQFYEQMWTSARETGLWEGEISNKNKEGEIYSEWLRLVSLKNDDGDIDGYIGSFIDVSIQTESNQRLYHLAHHDTLTGLPNRTQFSARLATELLGAQRRKGLLAVLFMDLDHFKDINDTLGHDIGDALLKEASRILTECVRRNDMIARQGGDEFIGILMDLTHAEDAAVVANKMLVAFKKPLMICGHKIFASTSIGISIYPNDADNAEDLTKHADSAMYEAKGKGRGCYHFYTDELFNIHKRRFDIENNLRVALKNDEFELFYQPQIDIATQKMVGVEALIRWHSAKLGDVGPNEFIPVAEESGLIIEIGVWVLQTACTQSHVWAQSGYTQMMMGINLSSVQFREPGFLDELIEIICMTKASPKYIDLELTERVIMKDDVATIGRLNELHECGIHLSIDDFGTGYSSMVYLKKFPVDKLKLDRSFIIDVTDNTDDAMIVDATINLGHNLGLTVIAEGVEEIEQVEWLREHGCDEIQGYFFSKPLPLSEIQLFMEKTGILERKVLLDNILLE